MPGNQVFIDISQICTIIRLYIYIHLYEELKTLAGETDAKHDTGIHGRLYVPFWDE